VGAATAAPAAQRACGGGTKARRRLSTAAETTRWQRVARAHPHYDERTGALSRDPWRRSPPRCFDRAPGRFSNRPGTGAGRTV